jgi:hypothetical protein
MQKTRRSLIIFSTHLLALSGCASSPKSTSFDGRWEFIKSPTTNENKACLNDKDTMRLRELLIRCEAPK